MREGPTVWVRGLPRRRLPTRPCGRRNVAAGLRVNDRSASCSTTWTNLSAGRCEPSLIERLRPERLGIDRYEGTVLAGVILGFRGVPRVHQDSVQSFPILAGSQEFSVRPRHDVLGARSAKRDISRPPRARVAALLPPTEVAGWRQIEMQADTPDCHTKSREMPFVRIDGSTKC
jgi:hypothetical protein